MPCTAGRCSAAWAGEDVGASPRCPRQELEVIHDKMCRGVIIARWVLEALPSHFCAVTRSCDAHRCGTCAEGLAAASTRPSIVGVGRERRLHDHPGGGPPQGAAVHGPRRRVTGGGSGGSGGSVRGRRGGGGHTPPPHPPPSPLLSSPTVAPVPAPLPEPWQPPHPPPLPTHPRALTRPATATGRARQNGTHRRVDEREPVSNPPPSVRARADGRLVATTPNGACRGQGSRCATPQTPPPPSDTHPHAPMGGKRGRKQQRWEQQKREGGAGGGDGGVERHGHCSGGGARRRTAPVCPRSGTLPAGRLESTWRCQAARAPRHRDPTAQCVRPPGRTRTAGGAAGGSRRLPTLPHPPPPSPALPPSSPVLHHQPWMYLRPS